MLRLRCFAGPASLALLFCLTPGGTWAQEPEEAASATVEETPAEEPKVDAFQYLFGRREESPEPETEAPADAPPTDPEAKRDAFLYLFGRRTQAAASEEQPAPVPQQPPAQKQPVEERQPAPPTPKPVPVTALSPAPAPAPLEAPKAQPAEPKPAAISPRVPKEPKETPKVEEKPKVDAFQYFFGRKGKEEEPIDSEQEKKEGEEGSTEQPESERPPS